MDLTNEQWSVLEPLIGDLPKRADGRGRPWRRSREVLNGIVWIVRTGAQWADLPDRYPPYQTCHRRFHRWVRDGTFERVLEALAEDLKERGKGTKLMGVAGQWQTILVFLSPSVPPRLRPRAGHPRRRYSRLPLRRCVPTAVDRRSRLRCRSARCGVGAAGHRDECAASPQSHETQDAGWPPAAPVPKEVDN